MKVSSQAGEKCFATFMNHTSNETTVAPIKTTVSVLQCSQNWFFAKKNYTGRKLKPHEENGNHIYWNTMYPFLFLEEKRTVVRQSCSSTS